MAIGDRYVSFDDAGITRRGVLKTIIISSTGTDYNIHCDDGVLRRFRKLDCKRLVKRDKFKDGWNAAIDKLVNDTKPYNVKIGERWLSDYLRNFKMAAK